MVEGRAPRCTNRRIPCYPTKPICVAPAVAPAIADRDQIAAGKSSAEQIHPGCNEARTHCDAGGVVDLQGREGCCHRSCAAVGLGCAGRPSAADVAANGLGNARGFSGLDFRLLGSVRPQRRAGPEEVQRAVGAVPDKCSVVGEGRAIGDAPETVDGQRGAAVQGRVPEIGVSDQSRAVVRGRVADDDAGRVALEFVVLDTPPRTPRCRVGGSPRHPRSGSRRYCGNRAAPSFVSGQLQDDRIHP